MPNHPFYHSVAWKCVAKFVRQARDYTCERCGGRGVIVHHIKHITPENIHDANVTLAVDNLMLLCEACHNKIHGGECDPLDVGFKFDDDGEIIKLPPIG